MSRGSNHGSAVNFSVKFLCLIVKNISVLSLWLIRFALRVISEKPGSYNLAIQHFELPTSILNHELKVSIVFDDTNEYDCK